MVLTECLPYVGHCIGVESWKPYVMDQVSPEMNSELRFACRTFCGGVLSGTTHKGKRGKPDLAAGISEQQSSYNRDFSRSYRYAVAVPD